MSGAHSGIPVIMITGKEETDTAGLAGLAGAAVLLVKPFDEMELISAVRKSLHLPTHD